MPDQHVATSVPQVGVARPADEGFSSLRSASARTAYELHLQCYAALAHLVASMPVRHAGSNALQQQQADASEQNNGSSVLGQHVATSVRQVGVTELAIRGVPTLDAASARAAYDFHMQHRVASASSRHNLPSQHVDVNVLRRPPNTNKQNYGNDMPEKLVVANVLQPQPSTNVQHPCDHAGTEMLQRAEGRLQTSWCEPCASQQEAMHATCRGIPAQGAAAAMSVPLAPPLPATMSVPLAPPLNCELPSYLATAMAPLTEEQRLSEGGTERVPVPSSSVRANRVGSRPTQKDSNSIF